MTEKTIKKESHWNQKFYINLLEEVNPFTELHLFRPLDRAYTGNNTFWSTPSPEPDLNNAFWESIIDYGKVDVIKVAAQNLVARIKRWQPDNNKILFVSILRAGVPVADWLNQMLPGSKVASLSLFVGLGIDQTALAQIKKDNPERVIMFVDGWTGRGGVAREIAKLKTGPLAVLIDPWGWAEFSGAQEDIFCYSACFTGLATLGFSRTFYVDNQSFFSAYRFPQDYLRLDVVEAWQKASPRQLVQYTQADRVKFFKDTSLRIHSNEVCRALINAAPNTLFFMDSYEYVREHYELLLALADRRGVPVQYNQLFLREYQTRVACNLETT
ncbi:hypothetical protein JWG39_00480 [Desulforhopalus vacuolatus]|uniref:cysteine protease StiP domain-containing protein n=1 Tax=Desulforhopalus vacuolatus TaxID=40414 RepID=UPI00196691C3|nr:cysteine protease StiP domain-containing protein [Desulforhopalus vacuolatus]MBM9518290.1 hypothetical protein [Desulforhopalus vacuolatus]